MHVMEFLLIVLLYQTSITIIITGFNIYKEKNSQRVRPHSPYVHKCT
jgi:hypothetical protein